MEITVPEVTGDQVLKQIATQNPLSCLTALIATVQKKDPSLDNVIVASEFRVQEVTARAVELYTAREGYEGAVSLLVQCTDHPYKPLATAAYLMLNALIKQPAAGHSPGPTWNVRKQNLTITLASMVQLPNGKWFHSLKTGHLRHANAVFLMSVQREKASLTPIGRQPLRPLTMGGDNVSPKPAFVPAAAELNKNLVTLWAAKPTELVETLSSGSYCSHPGWNDCVVFHCHQLAIALGEFSCHIVILADVLNLLGTTGLPQRLSETGFNVSLI